MIRVDGDLPCGEHRKPRASGDDPGERPDAELDAA